MMVVVMLMVMVVVMLTIALMHSAFALIRHHKATKEHSEKCCSPQQTADGDSQTKNVAASADAPVAATVDPRK